MKLTPQKYTDATFSEAVAAKCDLIQPKYDGQWCRVVVSRGIARVYDAYEHLLWDFQTNEESCCMLIGDFFGPPRDKEHRIVIWDCWSLCTQPDDTTRLEDTDLESYTYRNRFAIARQEIAAIGPPLYQVKNYPLSAAAELWETKFITKGLVYRRAADPVDTTIMVTRKYPELPGGLT